MPPMKNVPAMWNRAITAWNRVTGMWHRDAQPLGDYPERDQSLGYRPLADTFVLFLRHPPMHDQPRVRRIAAGFLTGVTVAITVFALAELLAPDGPLAEESGSTKAVYTALSGVVHSLLFSLDGGGVRRFAVYGAAGTLSLVIYDLLNPDGPSYHEADFVTGALYGGVFLGIYASVFPAAKTPEPSKSNVSLELDAAPANGDER